MIRCECKSKEGCNRDCDGLSNNYLKAINEARQLPPNSRSRVLDFIIDRAHGLNKISNAKENEQSSEELNEDLEDFDVSDARDLSLRNESKEQLEEVLKEIKEAALKGKKRLDLKRELSDNTIKALKEKGFTVTVQSEFYVAYEGIYKTIKW